MPTRFEIRETREADGTVRLALVGELDLATVDGLAARLQHSAARTEGVLLDLSELEFMDSTGLKTVLDASEHASRDGWELGITRPSRSVQRLFDVAGVSGMLPIVDS